MSVLLSMIYVQALIWKSAADTACGPHGEQEGKTASNSIICICFICCLRLAIDICHSSLWLADGIF